MLLSRATVTPTKQQAKDLAAWTEIEAEIQALGRQLLQAARSHGGRGLSRRVWADQLMQWAMRDQAFKVQIFRFIDTFPMLTSPRQVHEHLIDYLTQPGVTLPAGLGLGLKAGRVLKRGLASVVSSRVLAMGQRFILAGDVPEAMPRLRELWSRGMGFSVDLLGEACVSDAEAEAYQTRYLGLIETLGREVRGWPASVVLDSDYLGPIPRANVSVKITSLSARIKPADTRGSIDRLVQMLRPILVAAGQQHVLVSFDMEQQMTKDLTVELFCRCCEEVDFPAGLALQAYLRSGEEDAAKVIAWAKRTGRQVTVRLVKGAYWDYEVAHADLMGWPAPVWMSKRQTDACFERLTAMFVAQMPRSAQEGGVKLAVGSHNLRSIAAALALVHRHDLPANSIEVQMLYGMAEELQDALAERGLRVRQYAPVGPMIPGMAYLVRRLLENTSNESWLRAGFAHDAPAEALLASPHEEGPETLAPHAPQRHGLSIAVEGLGDGKAFANEPLRDFSRASVREDFAAAIARAAVPMVQPNASVEQAGEAIERARCALGAWRDTPVRRRADMLVEAAGQMRRQRDELAGIVIRESGKTWGEADADVCEAIDFCEYYARQAVALFEPQRLGHFTGELNLQWHEPRGVAVVISPWNFPLSICTGMTTAALVTGNTAVLKPAEQTPGIAQVLCEILWRAGVSRDVLQCVQGRGETVGAAMVRDPRVAIIAFTGSKAVGLDILQAAARTPEGQPLVKHVVCEMGGKNALIVDGSADLDEAVLGVRQSAFSYAGQKCSACSRVIVLDSIHDLFLRRLVEATRCLVLGDPMEPRTDIGPVIDAEAADKIRRYIAIGREEGRLELGDGAPAALEQRLGKPFVAPHIFSGIEVRHRLAQDEIFGPVLSVMRARDFQEALGIANSSEYKLTGGVFSRTPAHLERAMREFRVGNLYLNRAVTGALVGRQPFGGLGLSGAGSKAGGNEYLLHFVDARVCTENTMRRGFAPSGE